MTAARPLLPKNERGARRPWRGLVFAAFVVGDPASASCACTCEGTTPQVEPAEVAAGKADLPEKSCRDWSTLELDLPPLESPYAALLDEVWQRVLDKHYDPTFGCRDWPKLRLVYGEKLADAATDRDAYAVINAMLDELEHSHLRLFPPSFDDEPWPHRPALTVRWVQEQLVVVESRAVGPQGPVPAGATLLAIDDQPVQDILDRAHARAEGPGLARAIARETTKALSCPRAGQKHKLKITNPATDHGLAIRMVECVAPEGERVTLGNLRNVPTQVSWRMIGGSATAVAPTEGDTDGDADADTDGAAHDTDGAGVDTEGAGVDTDGGEPIAAVHGDVGYLRFNVWMLPMVKRVQEGIDALRAQGMRALVLDLRGNPGGVGTMAVPVARLLLDRERSLGTMHFRGFEQTLTVEVGDDPFVGPVAVLVDESTASTSEIFVIGLHDHDRITVVGGQPSAGAALPSVIDTMSDGSLLQYVVADYRSPHGTAVEGQGIVPDVRVVETRDDFAAGRDPVLDAAVRHLRAALQATDADADAAGSEGHGGTGIVDETSAHADPDVASGAGTAGADGSTVAGASGSASGTSG